MSAPVEQRAFELFDEVCDLPAAERAARLDTRCAGEPALRMLVERMLREDTSGDRHDLGPGAGAELIAAEIFADGQSSAGPAAIPENIGHYRILREVGRGGMGVVYEAEQEAPRRRVALKVIRDVLASEEARRRFRREAHLLGQLQHRGIAHVYEAGSARIGHADCPFIAMEFIEGATIDRHAELRGLTVRQRMELLARVCDAVQHAHQKGVIHRDLKPVNVLVTEEATLTGTDSQSAVVDSIGQPKVLDFGVGRLLEREETHAATMQTTPGQIVGTLASMSPEQVEGRPELVDTRTDVYALGVMLYRLLAGRAPFDLAGLPLAAAARAIREKEPERIGAIDRSLRGDAETIVCRAMEKDPARRYQTAGALADDLRRCIRNEPILARPATTLYHLRKFASRNKAVVGGLAAASIAVLGGLIVVSVLLARVSQERDRVTLARWRKDRVAAFQADVLSSIDFESMGRSIITHLQSELADWGRSTGNSGSVTVEQVCTVLGGVNASDLSRRGFENTVIDPAAAKIDAEYEDDPVVEATLRVTVARMYQSFYRFDKQLRHDERALELRQRALGEDHPDTLLSLARCAVANSWNGDTQAAVAFARRAASGAERVFGAHDFRTIQNRLALAQQLLQVAPDEAESILRSVIDTGPSNTQEGRMLLLRAEFVLANLLGASGRHAEAIEAYEQFLAHAPAAIPLRSCLDALANLAGEYAAVGQWNDATGRFREVVRVAADKLGEGHEITIVNRLNLAGALQHLGRDAEVERELRAAYQTSVTFMPATRQHRAHVALQWSQFLQDHARHEEALGVLEEVIAAREAANAGRDEWNTKLYLSLSACLRSLHRNEEADTAAAKAGQAKSAERGG